MYNGIYVDSGNTNQAWYRHHKQIYPEWAKKRNIPNPLANTRFPWPKSRISAAKPSLAISSKHNGIDMVCYDKQTPKPLSLQCGHQVWFSHLKTFYYTSLDSDDRDLIPHKIYDYSIENFLSYSLGFLLPPDSFCPPFFTSYSELSPWGHLIILGEK